MLSSNMPLVKCVKIVLHFSEIPPLELDPYFISYKNEEQFQYRIQKILRTYVYDLALMFGPPKSVECTCTSVQ